MHYQVLWFFAVEGFTSELRESWSIGDVVDGFHELPVQRIHGGVEREALDMPAEIEHVDRRRVVGLAAGAPPTRQSIVEIEPVGAAGIVAADQLARGGVDRAGQRRGPGGVRTPPDVGNFGGVVPDRGRRRVVGSVAGALGIAFELLLLVAGDGGIVVGRAEIVADDQLVNRACGFAGGGAVIVGALAVDIERDIALIGVGVHEVGQSDLLELVDAVGAAGAFARRRQGRQQHRRQNRDDCDHD
ncbi:hypothetical protein SDC9_85511 [bioreactor metagenome]|uniref:Uncharacterized protein n=1 Tax=bioreactor metagenome TaxID=1076179 RepID=A0A644ZDD3_9ZZZZ